MTQLANAGTLRSVDDIITETEYQGVDLQLLNAILNEIAWNLRNTQWGDVEYTGEVLFTAKVQGQLSVAAYLKLRSIAGKSGWKVKMENVTASGTQYIYVDVSV